MTGIYWAEGEATLKDYSAATKSGKSLVTIKIEVTNHHALAHLLRDLDRQIAAGRLTKRRPPLMITDQREVK